MIQLLIAAAGVAVAGLVVGAIAMLLRCALQDFRRTEEREIIMRSKFIGDTEKFEDCPEASFEDAMSK